MAAAAPPAAALLQCLCLLPLGRRSGRRSRQSLARAGTARRLGAGTRSLLRRPAVASRVRGAGADHGGLRYSRRAISRSAHGVSPGSDRAPVRDLERPARLLPLLGESRRQAGAVRLRLPRCGAAAAFRRYLHGPATGQFLAGRFPRSGEGPLVHSAGSAAAPRPFAGGHRGAAL